MILPLGDEPNPRSLPVVTYALMLINCAAYLFVSLPLSFVGPEPGDPVVLEYLGAIEESMARPLSPRGVNAIVQGLRQYDLFVFEWGFRPAAPQALNLLTAMFLHAGFLHLAGNMLFLWIYGDNVEYRLGRMRYLAAYLGTGVAVFGATAGATIIFLAARYAFADWVREKFPGYVKKLQDGFSRDAFTYVVILRLIPVLPFFGINIATALLNVPVRAYALGTLVGVIPGAYVYATVGATIKRAADTGVPSFGSLLTPELIFAMVAFAVLAVLPVVYRRMTQSKGDAA